MASSSPSLCCCSCCCPSQPFHGDAFDLILIQSADDPSLIDCGDVQHSLDMLAGLPPDVRRRCSLTLEIEQCGYETLKFPIVNNKIQLPETASEGETFCPPMERGGDDSERNGSIFLPTQHDPQALQLLASQLQPGNVPHYVLRSKKINNGDYEEANQEVVAMASGFSIYLWSSKDRVVVFDIDGTITRSNIRGFYDTLVTETYEYTHAGVCQFLEELSNDEDGTSTNTHLPIRLLYLSSRPYAMAPGTRKFLAEMRQGQRRLPVGPFLGSPKTVCEVIHMETVTKDAHVFKGATLCANIIRPWKAVSTSRRGQDGNPHNARDVFLAGFGNQTSDAQAYHEAGMDLCQIYVIDKQSQIRCLDGGIYNPTATTALRQAEDYMRRRGTHFIRGYCDSQLRKHVIHNVTDAQEALGPPV